MVRKGLAKSSSLERKMVEKGLALCGDAGGPILVGALGKDGRTQHMTNTRNAPIEAAYPLRVEELWSGT